MSDKPEEIVEEGIDQSFNDDELQDIMNEIENLEKEFVDGPDDSEVVETAPVAEEEYVEEEHVEEVHAEEEHYEEEPEEEAVCYDGPSENVVPMEPAAHVSSGGSQTDFSASGEMDFSMSFHVGGHQASLKIEKESGFSLSMEGVSFVITDAGCVVEMKGGMKFTVPFDQDHQVKKAS